MTTAAISEQDVTAELLLQIFDAPVSFHRCLVPIAGGVTAALLLSQALWITQTLAPDFQGWIDKSVDQWTEETGLTRWELQTARRALRDAGFMEELRCGMPSRLYYRVRPEQVWKALQDRARTSMHGRAIVETGRSAV